MQTVVIYRKADDVVIAAMKVNSFITQADVLTLPGHSYLITSKEVIFYTDEQNRYCVKVGDKT